MYECEICGAPTDGRIKRVVEGVLMIVCENCKHYGEPPPRKPQSNRSQKIRREGQSYYNDSNPQYSSNNYRKKRIRENRIGDTRQFTKKINYTSKKRIEDLDLIDNYRDVLRKLRQKEGLSMKAFANSVGIGETTYKHIETGKMELTIKDALKIEHKYDIKLTKLIDEDEEEEEDLEPELFNKENYLGAGTIDRSNDGELTLGDVFLTRKKKKKRIN
ncbi:MAG: helix-turn-helix domain-containing protein [Promethearchaeota archaeon]